MNVDMQLADFQDRFAYALFADGDSIAPGLAALVRQPGFAVYRNTVMKACIDALQANFPSVARLVGEEWFRAAAALHVQADKPQDPRMLFYGAGFPRFLADFQPAAALSYLPGIAQLDRYWCEAHAARDETPLDPTSLSRLAPHVLGKAVLHPHPSARWKWFDAMPIYTIWQRNRQAGEDNSEIAWQGEGALIVRPHAAVEWHPLNAAACALLDACADSRPLGEAAAAALDADPHIDLASLLAGLLEAGAFGSISHTNASLHEKESP